MTVKELIEILQSKNQEAYVVRPDCDGDVEHINQVEDIEIDGNYKNNLTFREPKGQGVPAVELR